MNKRVKKTNIDKEGNEYCFSYFPDKEGAFKIVKIYKGIKGYGELTYKHFTSIDEIKKEVEQMNLDFLGLNFEDVKQIELSCINGKQANNGPYSEDV